jgi:predicted histone-like DNA-binding protein
MIKIKAVQRKQLVGKYEGQYRFQMSPETYSALSQSKVIKEAALRSGVSRGVMQACWDAAGEVIKAWATEGHSVALPGLGTMRFGMNAKTCETVDEVKTSLITTRKVVFTPNVELKQELKNTAVKITCYDKDGNLITTVTSTDEGEVEDNEDDSNENENENGNNGGGNGDNNGSNENENENENPDTGDNNGGGNGGSGMDQN